jgi:peptidoglycan-associated lipoprotein
MTGVRFVSLLFVGIALASGGCSPKPATPPASPPSSATTPSTATRAASQSVAVGEDIAKACQVTVTNAASAEKAPKFDYDRVELTTEDRDVLSQIARCLTTGALKGRAVRLVGRADPRGESEYNMGLGGHRAGSVRTYLTQLGVDQKKIAETSRGELDARGKDEEGWRRDRRVDVLLQ